MDKIILRRKHRTHIRKYNKKIYRGSKENMITVSFKLYKSRKNKHLHQIINIAGIIYNHIIALNKRYYKLFQKRWYGYGRQCIWNQ